MLFEDKVMCPAHFAGFSIIDGKPEKAPALDGIPSFEIVERNGKSYVVLPEGGLPRKATMPMTKRDPSNNTHFVIVGGGGAGMNAAETLRQSGFSGRITIVTDEALAPYDRPVLSKGCANVDASKLTLRGDDFFKENEIELMLRRGVVKIDTD